MGKYWKTITIIFLPHYQVTEETRSLLRCCWPIRAQISMLISSTYQILKCSVTQVIHFRFPACHSGVLYWKQLAKGRKLKKCRNPWATLYQNTSANLLNDLKYKTRRRILPVSGNLYCYQCKSLIFMPVDSHRHTMKLLNKMLNWGRWHIILHLENLPWLKMIMQSHKNTMPCELFMT